MNHEAIDDYLKLVYPASQAKIAIKKILDENCAVVVYPRKYAIALLNHLPEFRKKETKVWTQTYLSRQNLYKNIKLHLAVCSPKLKAAIPPLIAFYPQHF